MHSIIDIFSEYELYALSWWCDWNIQSNCVNKYSSINFRTKHKMHVQF